MLKVSEIFTSIQGESTFAGLPCTFIRLAGCNLRCRWCDTPYTRSGGGEKSVDKLLEEISRGECRLVELTGGEPLLQADAFTLVARLLDRGRTVLVETNGTVDIRPLDRRAVVVMDIKCPGSGECGSLLPGNIELLKGGDQVKFVISSRDDFDWAGEFIEKYPSLNGLHLLFSPVRGECEPGALAAWILGARLPVRLQLQLHKYIWPGVERGV